MLLVLIWTTAFPCWTEMPSKISWLHAAQFVHSTSHRTHNTAFRLRSWISHTYQSVRVRVTLRLAVCRQSVRLAANSLETHNQSFFFQLNSCSHIPYVISSLTRGWVCRLQLLLAHVSVVILGYESHGTYDHILLSQIRDSPKLEGQVSVFICPRNGLARLYPQALGSLFVAYHVVSHSEH
jgi:hypothetical protein